MVVEECRTVAGAVGIGPATVDETGAGPVGRYLVMELLDEPRLNQGQSRKLERYEKSERKSMKRRL